MKNEVLLKSLLNHYSVKLEPTNNMDDPNIKVEKMPNDSNDKLPIIKRIESEEKNNEHPHEYKCQYCKKSFLLKQRWLRHTRVHTKERPYKCDQCDLSFTMTSSLNRHKTLHTGEQPYVCQICGKGKHAGFLILSFKSSAG